MNKRCKSISKIIEAFCENAAELGCPRDSEVDMWYRYMDGAQQSRVVEKLFKIMSRRSLPMDPVKNYPLNDDGIRKKPLRKRSK